jgi:hypothetical protein
MIIVLGLINLISGIFKSSKHLSGIFSIYLIMSYEKYPTKREQRGGRFLGNGKLKLSISFFKKV